MGLSDFRPLPTDMLQLAAEGAARLQQVPPFIYLFILLVPNVLYLEMIHIE